MADQGVPAPAYAPPAPTYGQPGEPQQQGYPDPGQPKQEYSGQPQQGYPGQPQQGYPGQPQQVYAGQAQQQVVFGQPQQVVFTQQPAMVGTTTIIQAAPLPYRGNDCLACSILHCMFCNFILGIIAIVFSCKAQDAYSRGDRVEGDKSANVAKILNIIGPVLGLLIFIIVIVLVAIVLTPFV